ncbi:putative methyltransferase DDB_G0268948 [Engystomops pustulosus]|uniref:putative methyltransferase DDB_G0268948 n=1 Tax=Engystomops pustulosus TaxID=76066 RepID=UPI003AFA5F8A
MVVHLYKKITFSLAYQRYMIPFSNEVMNLIFSYVKEKAKGQSLDMALDVGCGTGRYTLPLSPHFKKVLGIDISESQINVAKQYNTANNVSYMVAPAEKLPMKNDSVDLVNAGLAAHWFAINKFGSEAVRVLKTNGCLALHGFYPATEIKYKDLSHDLNKAMSEMWDTLFQHLYALKLPSASDHMFTQYQNIYEAIPLTDKEWITDIPVKIPMSLPEIIGFIQSFCPFQILLQNDVKKAEQFLIQTEKRFRDILGEEADVAQLNAFIKHYCVLACKH